MSEFDHMNIVECPKCGHRSGVMEMVKHDCQPMLPHIPINVKPPPVKPPRRDDDDPNRCNNHTADGRRCKLTRGHADSELRRMPIRCEFDLPDDRPIEAVIRRLRVVADSRDFILPHVDRSDIGRLLSAYEELLDQLPEGMRHCTILFKECEKGHGRLVAANWIDRGCQLCILDDIVSVIMASGYRPTQG